MILAFWILLFIIFYAYVGYTLVLLFLRIFITNKKRDINDELLPEVTLLIAAYNEKDFVHQKVSNTYELDYPKDKINVMWITDGSNDDTPNILKQYEDIVVLHEDERKGKTAAINRAMKHITTPITVFSDANTLLNKDAIKEIVSPFEDNKTGCVAGEKRIINKKHDSATGSGEGTYWQYESLIKTSESIVGSTMGAVGELFALRTELFVPVPDNSIIDDFVISLTIALKGYKIGYA
ncbi:MAG: glycosyltransferase family 2 protein, partial [Bacteroidales bacterium]|nr:glycosyltransferase family 2 protein [Bacteroidales bacterium]